MTEEDPANDLGLAMVALKTRALDPRVVAGTLGTRFGMEATVAKTGEPYVLSIEGGEAYLMTVPIGLPRADFEAACARSWHWPGASAALAEHHAHAIVTVTSKKGTSRLEQALRLSRVVAAVAASENAAAVYWGAAGVVHEPADFIDEVASVSSEYVPVMLWVSLEPFVHKGRKHMATRGLEALGHAEVEAELEGPRADRLLEFLPDLIAFVVTSGEKLEDGHTIGGSAEEKFRVRVKKSLRGDAKVLFVAAGG